MDGDGTMLSESEACTMAENLAGCRHVCRRGVV